MKQVIMSLVVVGGLLVTTPAIFETVKMSQGTRILSDRPDLNNLTLGFELRDTYCFGCWFTGSLMALAGIHLSYRMLAAPQINSTHSSLSD